MKVGVHKPLSSAAWGLWGGKWAWFWWGWSISSPAVLWLTVSQCCKIQLLQAYCKLAVMVKLKTLRQRTRILCWCSNIWVTGLSRLECKSEEVKTDILSFSHSLTTNSLPKSCPRQKQEINPHEGQEDGEISEHDMNSVVLHQRGELKPKC